MEHEPGDDYVRRIAAFIRTNEQGLAAAGDIRRRRRPKSAPNTSDSSSVFNPLGWFSTAPDNYSASNIKPVILSFDVHHLFYLLMRMEALGLPVGNLDVKVDNPSRPMNYVNIPHAQDKSDTLSLRSFASSFSAVSRLSLGGGWWGRPPPPTVDSELKYIYSSLTKLPAITLHAPEPRVIAELANEAPNENAIPFETFKNIQMLECVDVDPRTLLGWDRLAEGLRSLSIKKSGLEDIADVFIGAVMDDQARSEGRIGTERLRRIPKAPPSRQSSFRATRLPESVPEDAEEAPPTPKLSDSPISDESHVLPAPDSEDIIADSSEAMNGDTPRAEDAPAINDTPTPSNFNELPSLKWAFLRHLSLSDNALTFLPSSPLPYLTSLTHLDLSSNLLVSVPPGLSALYNLVSLNLSDNMIDSVLGIYTMLGQVLTLNLSRNRLESICGLERLLALERVDLRHNIIEESLEIGRLSTLPNITEVYVEGNPLTEIEESYRVRCFDLFWKEGKSILLDGTPPGYYEKRYLTSMPSEQMSSSRPISAAYSPPAVPVGAPSSPQVNGITSGVGSGLGNEGVGSSATAVSKLSPRLSPTSSSSPSQSASPQLAAVVGKGRRKKIPRIVDLDGRGSEGGVSSGGSRSGSHSRMTSEVKMGSPKVGAISSPAKGGVSAARGRNPMAVGIVSSEAVAGPSTVVPPSASRVTEKPVSPPPVPRTKLSRHSRHHTEFVPVSSNTFEDPIPSTTTPKDGTPASPSRNGTLDRPTASHRRSATMSSRSATRRARVSASLFEGPGGNGGSGNGGGAMVGDGKPFDESAAFRARIEALRSDMGMGG
ncbi:hypothetical protein NLI96_g2372 [Meripilus lineatus]|uniref:Uncharacterized protein n=1 Tax=Meripilus lineatus TaxID=2056292 RepID=A0AAD5VDC1_9APHY|nr:hypothetical protein NLI96_g2372 [Physisporinus lineatus]